jgi:hypothetical protein
MGGLVGWLVLSVCRFKKGRLGLSDLDLHKHCSDCKWHGYCFSL